MVLKHNNQLPNQHFRKDWQLRVKTWFNQPGRKLRRRRNRIKKAELIAPRPIDGLLRPAVRCQTVKYNTKLRLGRGFTLDELKEAGIRRKEARSIGIAVDHRRRNKSLESLQLNAQRLSEYKAKLIVFPKKANKPKAGDSKPEALRAAVQLKTPLLPLVKPSTLSAISTAKITNSKVHAYATLRKAQSDKKLKGIREERAKAKAEEEAAKKK